MKFLDIVFITLVFTLYVAFIIPSQKLTEVSAILF